MGLLRFAKSKHPADAIAVQTVVADEAEHRSIVSRKLLIAIFLVVLVGGAVVITDFNYFLNQPVNLGANTLTYEIPTGTSFRSLVSDLYERGILDRPLYWRLLARVQGKAEIIKAGEYRIAAPLTPEQLLDHFVAGKTAQYSFTILEGWTYNKLREEINRHPQIVKTLTDDDDLMSILSKPGVSPEGWFYPDTYHFPKGTTDVDFLTRSHELMKQRLQSEWHDRVEGLPLKTPYEALIMASIVEKETAVSSERPMIAAVFLSRLRKGMRLQTDPTVIYGLGSDYDGNLTRKNLRSDTPYNTYLRSGLTPSPIAMPGGGALHAVLHPADTKALYFVAKGDGNHYFSESYDEHRKAVIRYQLGGNKARYKSRGQR